MAQIIKDRGEFSVSPAFEKVNKRLKNKKLKKNRIISTVLLLISVGLLAGYYWEFSSYYKYFIYSGLIVFLFFLCSLFKSVSGLTSYFACNFH